MSDATPSNHHLQLMSYPELERVHAGWSDDPRGATLCGVIGYKQMDVHEIVPSGKRLCSNCTRILNREQPDDTFVNRWREMAGEA